MLGSTPTQSPSVHGHVHASPAKAFCALRTQAICVKDPAGNPAWFSLLAKMAPKNNGKLIDRFYDIDLCYPRVGTRSPQKRQGSAQHQTQFQISNFKSQIFRARPVSARCSVEILQNSSFSRRTSSFLMRKSSFFNRKSIENLHSFVVNTCSRLVSCGWPGFETSNTAKESACCATVKRRLVFG